MNERTSEQTSTPTSERTRATAQRGLGLRLRWRRPRYVRGKLFASKQRGIALVMVMIAISIVLAITNQFGTNATIDMMSAANYRDQMRAHFLARTALNVSELVIRMQQVVEEKFKGVDITEYADQLMMAFCGNREEISEILGVPADQVKGLGSEVGGCGLMPAITTDDSKINLNCALSTDAEEYSSLRKRLTALFSFPAYDPIFDEDDAEGWHRNRETQAAALMDYIDKDSLRFQDRGTSEDYAYESLKDDYKPKQQALDSIGELRQVRGVDDRFWALFGKSFTVYGGCKVTLNSVEDVPLLAAILSQGATNDADRVNQQKLYALAAVIIKAREFGVTFKNVDAFIKFVKDPDSEFSTNLSPTAAGGQSASVSPVQQIMQSLGLPPGQKPGIELTKSNLPPLEFKRRRTFRVFAYGEVNRAQVDAKGNPIFPPVRRTITGVWDTKPVPQNARKSAGAGAWVYLKEE